ncbi:RhuM family protein [Stenotrophomonas sp.]|uniref:RhuM family protein n=1 Tax=Stenotrophomonas sp. TaxID=69392 RepID=UPI0028AC7D9E|nr:RhuM family protein [Stenotrophomonas sp.]
MAENSVSSGIIPPPAGRALAPVSGQGEFLFYETEDTSTRVQLRLLEGSVWMSQRQLGDLYQVRVPTINAHLRTLFQDGELAVDRTIRKFLIVAREGTPVVERLVDHYNLEVILQLGYRVRPHRGTQFCRWATELLKTYLTNGVLLDDERFKRGDDAEYFENLLARTRDIRLSENVFWRKVLDIYATSMDYDPNTETSQQFFATVQSKMPWVAHGHTAAELTMLRVDADGPNMGLTSCAAASKGGPPRNVDIGIAKNYLKAEELDTLNRIVTAYNKVAELQAQARQPMTMRDWAEELDNFLRLIRKDILPHAGNVSGEVALAKVREAYTHYQQRMCNLPSKVAKDFEAAIAQPVKQFERSRKALPGKKAKGKK